MPATRFSTALVMFGARAHLLENNPEEFRKS
jgi:hypothetical protein